MTMLKKEHWDKIRENNKNLREQIDKIEIVGITAEEYKRKFPKLARLINLEEVTKMKLVKQTINVPAKVGKVKAEAPAKAIKLLVPEGHITPKDIAKELKTSPKALRKVIRKLKLTRTGKQWHWAPTDKEINLIKEAYLKSIQPKPEPETVQEMEAAEEDAPEVVKVPPAM